MTVFGAGGVVVSVDGRGALSSPPLELSSGHRSLRLVSWAGPWAVDERWWSDDASRAWRFQAVDSTGCAWLLALDGGGWWAEARYD
jgi:protein ImuB